MTIVISSEVEKSLYLYNIRMKLFRHIALASILTASFFCSCSKEQNPVQGEEMRISYNVSIPETKAHVTADGAAINKVWYALYNTDGTLATKYAPVDFVGGNARCEVVMMRDRSYKIVFVAQHYSDEATSAYPIDAQNALIGIPQSPLANTDKYDLFYGTQDVTASGSAGNLRQRRQASRLERQRFLQQSILQQPSAL